MNALFHSTGSLGQTATNFPKKRKKIVKTTRLIAGCGGACFLLLSSMGCGGYAKNSKDGVAILTANKTSMTIGDTVQLDASASVYQSVSWTINGSTLDECGTSDICSLQLNTEGTFEIGIIAKADSTATTSLIVKVVPSSKTSAKGAETFSSTTSSSSSASSTVSGFIGTTGKLTYIEMKQDGVNSVDGLSMGWDIQVSPDNKSVYVSSIGESAIAVFSRNEITGALSYVEVKKNGIGGTTGLSQIYGLAVSPDNKSVYGNTYQNDGIVVFSRNTSTGALNYIEAQTDGVGGVDGLDGSWALTVSPDSKFVYAVGQYDDAVSVFSRNTTTGALTYVEMQKNGVGGVNGLDGARSVVVSPDNKFVYTAGTASSAVSVFSRNESTGTLTYIEVKSGISGLSGVESVTVSADNKSVYAAGGSLDSIVVFSRNTTTGALTYVETKQDGVGGVDGLDLAQAVIVSPDNKHVYAIGWGDSAVAVFSRNETTGALTYVEMKQDGVGGVDGMNYPRKLAISPDNKHVYAVGSGENAIAAFSRE